MNLTPALLRQATGSTPGNAIRYAPHLEQACAAHAIATPRRLAHYLAQIGHESRGLSTVVENLNYSVDALLSLFGRHRITVDAATRYGRSTGRPANQEHLANILYGGEWGRANLGNDRPGDGWRYRGRGLKQITGRANYRAATLRLQAIDPQCPDLEDLPDLVQLDRWAAWTAADFWGAHGCNDLADRDDLEAVTRAVNGGTNGIDDRRRRLAMAHAAIADHGGDA